MSTMRFSDQSSVFYLLFQYILCNGSPNNGNNAETQYILNHVSHKEASADKDVFGQIKHSFVHL